MRQRDPDEIHSGGPMYRRNIKWEFHLPDLKYDPPRKIPDLHITTFGISGAYPE